VSDHDIGAPQGSSKATQLHSSGKAGNGCPTVAASGCGRSVFSVAKDSAALMSWSSSK
jgi:hypothetical protein